MQTGLGMSQPSAMDAGQLQNSAMDLVSNICSIVCTPLDMVLRPWYGSEFVPPFVLMFSGLMMLVFPALGLLADSYARFLPFGAAGPVGLFSMWSLSKLFFLGAAIHGWRCWRLMLHMEREENSFFAGPPLPIFYLVPVSWWTIRIFVEPLTVVVVAIVLQNLYILQSGASTYLTIAAFALAMRNFTSWLSQWQIVRHLMNTRFIGPILNKMADNTATDDELAKVHLASFPKNIPEDIRQSAVSYITRSLTEEK